MSTPLEDSEIIAPRNDAEEKLRDFSMEYVPFSDADCFNADFSAEGIDAYEFEPCLAPTENTYQQMQQQVSSQPRYNSYNQNQYGQQNTVSSQERIFLNVPYAEKDEAKALGARWDSANKKWYITANLNADLFKKWL